MIPYLNIHTHHYSQQQDVDTILSLSVGYDDLRPMHEANVALGIHPWFINEDTSDDDIRNLKEMAKNNRVRMIGECGLDKIKGAKFELQQTIFADQLRLAKELKKPVILHCVKAYDELMAMTKEIDPQVPMVIHGFNKSEQLGQQLMSHGFSLSFGKTILEEHSGAAALLRKSDVFFLETDDSETPIETVYAAAANLKNMTLDDLKALIFANWKNLNLI